jgi:hypothetical protein
VYFAALRINLISAAVSLDLSFDFTVHVSLPYSDTGRANVVYSFILVPFLTFFGLNVLLIIHVICKKFVLLLSILYDTKFPK